MTFLEIALACIRRGWYVFPCWPETKDPMTKHAYKDASNDEDVIRAWWARTPDANVAIATGASGLTVWDCDKGIDSEDALKAFMAAHDVPHSFAIRTGRRPDFAAQVYFSEPIPSFNHWEVDGCTGDIRGTTGYVMAAGSIHPKSKEAYTVLWDYPIVPVPEFIRGLKFAPRKGADGKELPPRFLDDGPIDEWRNDAMIRLLGKKRSEGADDEALTAYALRVNEDRMVPPLEEEELTRLIANACRFPIPQPDPVAILGKSKTVEVTDVEDAEPVESGVRPRYPVEVWDGTPYGEFAELSAADNYVPRKFFIEAMRTVVGAIVGDKLSSPDRGVNPRAYTILIAPPGTGKGTAFDSVRDFFAERWEGLTRTEAPLMFDSPKEFLWRGRGIGAQIINPASAPGLIMAIEEKKPKKGDTANPLAEWKPMPRIITMSEEVRALFANFQNESTGAGLESVLCELFDRDSFSSTATKDREPKSGRLMYSMLGGITPDGWTNVFSKTESTESGFLSRVNIIGTENILTVSSITPPDYGPLRNKLFPLIRDLEANPKRLVKSREAKGMMDEWYNGLVMPEGISKARLNIHAWRAALHLAWLHGHTLITQEDADGGRRLAEYLAKMREHYAPPEGETRGARCESAIRKVMAAKRRVTLRELKQKTNYTRYGLGLWDKALKSLVQAGEVRIDESGRAKTVILLKIKD